MYSTPHRRSNGDVQRAKVVFQAVHGVTNGFAYRTEDESCQLFVPFIYDVRIGPVDVGVMSREAKCSIYSIT